MKHILDLFLSSGHEEHPSDENSFVLGSYINASVNSLHEPLQEEGDDFEWDEYGNLLDKYK